ncbi:MAG: NADP-dependent malic enzyme [Myxococcales bacterium]|jgi:malate dehydrogenase (oxaloacetate-decarboxylating)(NADP+)|nr:NADP-dependent malic enzyme [Myxococcales bacterium]
MHRREDALRYHREGRPGKIELAWTKPVASQLDLSLAYSPGVADPCREIFADPDQVDTYTARRNLVAVVTNGTAVLGLGDIGPRAAKPVMEGKAVLFKRFADIDVFDLELDEKDPERVVQIVRSLEPTFGGINLEDIRAPDCFYIERALREQMQIPVFHDDQHGTAIISAAALLNACELQEKHIDEVRVTCVGAGAAATSCMQMWVRMGVPTANITMVDIHGVVHDGRDDLDEFRAAFARPSADPRRTLAEAVVDADVLIGLSAGGIVTPEMLKTMAPRPIVFALANPDPEIAYPDAVAARPDAVVATGRSDFPNQVNNVLGFPYIFRGALDVRARAIDEEMKLAAAHAIAALARAEVPEDVLRAYGHKRLKFGPEYIIPKPFDSRVLFWVAPAVAEAALRSGVARDSIDIEDYRNRLYRQLSPARRVLWNITEAAKSSPCRIVYPEGDHENIIRAARRVADANIAQPILLGVPERILSRARAAGISLDGVSLVDPRRDLRLERYAHHYWERRCRKGVTQEESVREMQRFRTSFGMMMVEVGDADGIVAGARQDYPATIRPALRIIGTRPDVRKACGMYMVITKTRVTFLADTTINIDPDAQTLAEIARLAAERVRELGIEPRVAMLSFSNFGDAPHPASRKVAEATALVKKCCPELMIDGEMQANVAMDPQERKRYPFSDLRGPANVLVFPNLDAGNAAYKLLAVAGGADVIGPMLLGMNKPVNVLQQGATVDAIVHMTAITVTQAQRGKNNNDAR